jgi:hypothetical protein
MNGLIHRMTVKEVSSKMGSYAMPETVYIIIATDVECRFARMSAEEYLKWSGYDSERLWKVISEPIVGIDPDKQYHLLWEGKTYRTIWKRNQFDSKGNLRHSSFTVEELS